MPRWQADYRCLSCSATWTQPAGPTQCPRCGHLYVKWTNYEVLAAKGKVTPAEQHAKEAS